MEDSKLNSFAAVLFSRTSLILTQPSHVMYIPLSNYLVAKSSLNLSTIPELYTLLHSSDVHYKEHRMFILNVLKDGMRSKEDFEVALRSMAFKLLMELYDSCLSDIETKILILNFLRNATKIQYGVKLLCSSYGLLSWLCQNVRSLSGEDVNTLLPFFVEIIGSVVRNKIDGDYVALFVVSHILDELLGFVTKEDLLLAILDCVSVVFVECPRFLNEIRLRKIIEHVGDKRCDYYLQYGSKFVDFQNGAMKTVESYVRKITLDYLELHCT